MLLTLTELFVTELTVHNYVTNMTSDSFQIYLIYYYINNDLEDVTVKWRNLEACSLFSCSFVPVIYYGQTLITVMLTQ